MSKNTRSQSHCPIGCQLRDDGSPSGDADQACPRPLAYLWHTASGAAHGQNWLGVETSDLVPVIEYEPGPLAR